MKKNKKISEPTPAALEEPKAVETSESEAPAKKRRFSRKTLIKIMFVISVIFIMISLTYSWFTYSNNANVNGLEIQVTDPNNLIAGGIEAIGEVNTVAGNGTEFFTHQLVNIEAGDPVNGFQAYKKVPKKDKNGVGFYEPLNDDVISAVADVQNVLVKDFTLKITGEHTINMIKGSQISVSEALKPALRVTLLKFDAEKNEYVPLFVWVPYAESVTVVYPDDDSDLGKDADGASEMLRKKTDTEAEGSLKYYWGEIGDTPISLGNISGEGKFRVVVWLDGNATTAEYQSVSGQAVTVKLKFLPEAVAQDAAGKPSDELIEEPVE